MANANLNVTFSISSSDLFNTVNLAKTVSDAVVIDGDNRQGLTTMVTSTSYADINVEALAGTTQGGKKAYVYAKNTDATDSLILQMMEIKNLHDWRQESFSSTQLQTTQRSKLNHLLEHQL